MPARKCVAVKKGKDNACVCARYIPREVFDAMSSEGQKKYDYETMCMGAGLTRKIGSTILGVGNNVSVSGTKTLQGGSTMAKKAQYEAPIEEYGLSSLDAVIETASNYLPSKSEFKNILIAGGGAGIAFVAAEYGTKFLAGFIPVSEKVKNWVFVGLKVLAAAAGGKALYRFNTELGTGFAVGMMLSALRDVARATGIEARLLPASTAAAGYGNSHLFTGTGQVDIEEHQRLAQVDVEEHDHLVGVYGYVPSETSYVAM